MILFGIIVWLICSAITSGMVLHIFPDEFDLDDDALLVLILCIIGWPLFVIFGIVYYILMKISLLAIFMKGFLDAMSKEEQRGKRG